MKNQSFRPEHYPIVIQVISQNGVEYLSGFQPDFNYRVIEGYRANDHGQTEMMIIKIRREMKAIFERKGTSPTPSKSAAMFRVPEQTNLSAKDVARIYNVNEMTVRRWADMGKIKCTRTKGGHRRFCAQDLEDVLAGGHPLREYSPKGNDR